MLPFFVEPVGLKAPTFSTDFKMAWYVKDESQGFALLCPAQAYPAPLFRYFHFYFKIYFGFILSPTFSGGKVLPLGNRKQRFPVPLIR